MWWLLKEPLFGVFCSLLLRQTVQEQDLIVVHIKVVQIETGTIGPVTMQLLSPAKLMPHGNQSCKEMTRLIFEVNRHTISTHKPHFLSNAFKLLSKGTSLARYFRSRSFFRRGPTKPQHFRNNMCRHFIIMHRILGVNVPTDRNKYRNK